MLRSTAFVILVLGLCGCRAASNPPATRAGEETLCVLDWTRHTSATGTYYLFTFDPLKPEDPCMAKESGGVRAENVVSQAPDQPCPLQPGKAVTRIVVLEHTTYIPLESLKEYQDLKRKGRWPEGN